MVTSQVGVCVNSALATARKTAEVRVWEKTKIDMAIGSSADETAFWVATRPY